MTVLSHLKISGFRAFREFRVDGLTRVNLFVGTNNSGKTTILEAAELVAFGTAGGLLRGPGRRGESIWLKDTEDHRQVLDLSHIFYGHGFEYGTFFEISGGPGYWIRCEVTEPRAEEYLEEQAIPLDLEEPAPVLLFNSYLGESRYISPVSPAYPPRFYVWAPGGESVRRVVIGLGPVQFLGTEPVTASRLSQLWDAVVLTPEEEGVVAAIQIVEPGIERIAFVGDGRSRRASLKVAGMDQPFPLESTGDGLKRLLGIALHLFSAKGGYLMVDEIDTGLHHTVMVKMWKLVIETAKRLDVQVLATTHSLDCVRALAWVQEQNPDMASEVTLHRVERGLPSTVRYTMDELAIAAEHHLEVR